MPGQAPGAQGSGLVARRERPGCLGVQRGLCRRGSSRGRRLGGLLGGCSLLGRGCLLGGSGLLRCYGLLGRSGFLGRCCCLLGRRGLLRCYGLLGGSGFLGRCCCLLGGSGLLRCYSLLGRSGFLCRCSFLRWGCLLGGRFFRSCHHVLLGSICKEHFLSSVGRKRSMGMERNSMPMNTGTPRTAALCGAVGVGRGVRSMVVQCVQESASPRTARHRIGIRSRGFRRSYVPSSGRSFRSSTGTGSPRWGTAFPGRSAWRAGWRCSAGSP